MRRLKWLYPGMFVKRWIFLTTIGIVFVAMGFAIVISENTSQNKTFAAIVHAKSRIQSLISGKIQSKFCPVLHFFNDDKFKKTLETLKLIEKVTDNPEEDNVNNEITEY